MLAGLDRPGHPAVRWTAPEQWHVTLRFLGPVPEGDLPALHAALERLACAHRARPATMGPATARLNRSVLAVPVAGVDDLGAALVEATGQLGAPVGPRRFTAHLTLARGRGRRPVPVELVGQVVEATWPVEELALVRSHLGPGGARYETLATFPLA